jgi:RNA polymerase sigma factor (sigma-70 family)
VEVSALTHKGMPGLSGPSALLRLQSDERLIAMTRRGQHAAFEVLFARYQSRLLAFCRHMLGSREDAEDVLQEVFTAAFNAILADEREINVRPWLYRIARNRSLNHLRRASAIGVDSMDVHFADHGLSTGERVMRRESFRQLLGDVNELPETQRTALLLREIDALSYEQIADAMETTVPSVKSLLVRARISLAEAAEARKLSCDEVRLQLGEAAEGLAKLGAPVRRHVRGCERCRFFKRQLKTNNQALAAIFPVGPLLMAKKLVLSKLGSTASAGSAHVGAGAGATASATATAGAAASAGGGAGGILTAGAGALATKAVAGLAAAAIVTAGAVEAEHASRPVPHHHRLAASAYAPATTAVEPVVVDERVQPATVPSVRARLASFAPHRKVHPSLPPKGTPAVDAPVKLAAETKPSATSPTTAIKPATTPADAKPAPAPTVTQVTSQTTVLPASATSEGTPAASAPEVAPAGATEAATGGTVAVTETPPTTQTAPASPPVETAPEAPPAETTAQPSATPAPEGEGPATSSPDQTSTGEQAQTE